LLVAALQPPVGRMQLVAKLDEIAGYDGADYALGTNRWASGTIEPHGYVHIESFRLEGTMPVWRFATGDAILEKRVWMLHGENTTYVQYTLLRGSQPMGLELRTLINYRDFHSNTHAGDWRMKIDAVKSGLQVTAFDGATPFYLLSANAQVEARHEWCRDYFLPLEKYRGLDDREDNLLAAIFRVTLQTNQSVSLVFSTDANAALDGDVARDQSAKREADLLAQWSSTDGPAATAAPGWIRQLILAADQFVVRRDLADSTEVTEGKTIIAGYHWFGDWGRDTMIALPGLTLATGRADIAKQILLSFARYIDGGMLPNNFPDAGGRPEYNTVDAALWFFEAVRQYFAATQDNETLARFFPVMAQMIDAHVTGTRYQIHVDQADGLLYAGEPGVQLTWMDAKVGDWVVTPRRGKAVEINALWYNALRLLASWLGDAGDPEAAARAHHQHPVSGLDRPGVAQQVPGHRVADGHHRRLVPGARPHIEGSVAVVQLERLNDHRDHERLADGLPRGVDRQRPVGIGALPISLEHELLAGHARHRMEHGRRPNSVLDQRRHHPITIRRSG